MSTITNATNTIKVNWKPAMVVTLVLAVIAVLANPSGPLGSFWRPSADSAVPPSTILPLFILFKIAEGLSFGIGISFLIFGYPIVKAISPASTGLTRAAHFSIAWLLFSWWPHDSLHIHNGMSNMSGLLIIEYAFHITAMIAGVILVRFFLTLLRRPV
jgi:hypothetical protein